MRLVQLTDPEGRRRVALVDEPHLRLLRGSTSVYALAQQAIEQNVRLAEVIEQHTADQRLTYDDVYSMRSDWALLPAADCPDAPARCFVTGTGLTHRASAENRQRMHAAAGGVGGLKEPVTDSMRMYRLGLEGGRPAAGEVGAQPEWFYKGTGAILRAHGKPLDSPWFADDGGDEAEIAGVYLIAPDGTPCRIGLVQGNEFSDHVLEARNYLYLAASKLRNCSVGPEIVIDFDFSGEVTGESLIRRGEEIVWRGRLASGEKWMCHSLANLEHHHFCNAAHCRRGDLHIHFLGADAFSFRDRVRLEDGDVMEIRFDGFGRPLRNPIRIDQSPPRPVRVKPL
jgi:hypothetical protein